jgi:hypothetical protein
VRRFIEAASPSYEAAGADGDSKAFQPSSLGLGRFRFSRGFRVKGPQCQRSTIRRGIAAPVNQTDVPFRRSELRSTLSQLKQWKLRMSELDWDELADRSVIGARQFEQG